MDCEYESKEGNGCAYVKNKEFMDAQLRNYNDKFYCPFHLPIDAKRELSVEDKNTFKNLFVNHFGKTSTNNINVEGVEFLNFVNLITTRYIELRGCVFVTEDRPGSMISIITTSDAEPVLSLDNCQFIGTGISIEGHLANKGIIDINQSFISGGLIMKRSLNEDIPSFSITSSKIDTTLYLKNIKFTGSFCLMYCTLPTAIEMENTVFSHDTTFIRNDFSRAMLPENTNSFRSLRQSMSDLSNRELEGEFFIYEKRCDRSQFGKYSLKRIFSKLYDVFSGYGTDFVKPTTYMLGVIGFSWYIYFLLKVADTKIDSQISSSLFYALKQAFKPFNIFSPKELELETMNAVSRFVLITTSILESIMVLLMFALTVLALRWKFKKG